MTELLASEPNEERPHDSAHHSGSTEPPPGGARRAGRHSGRRTDRQGPLDAEGCLELLQQLAGAVALGLIAPAAANVLRAVYTEILRYRQNSATRSNRTGLADADVLELLRRDPQMMSILEPFLTAAQIAMVLQGADDDSEQA